MAAVYAGIDILAMPSINEGMPMTLIEALAASRPIVATAVGDVPKLIRDGETGLLVESRNPEALASAIVKLLSDPLLRLRFAEEGRKHVLAHFSANAMASQTGTLQPSLAFESEHANTAERGNTDSEPALMAKSARKLSP